MKIISLCLFSILYLITFSSSGNGPSGGSVYGFADSLRAAKKSLKICVISDLNSSYGSTTYSKEVIDVVSKLKSMRPDMILIPGDMVAGQKASLTIQNIRDMWASFKVTVLNPVQELNIPLAFTVGNHDASPGFQTDRAEAESFWKSNKGLTGLEFVDDSHYPFYFSYKKGNVFFISWDAAASKIDPDVYVWMKTQLKSRVARKSRLQVLTGHLPLYAIVESKNKPGEVNSDPEFAMNFFKEHGIDLYISGHQHAYYPAVKNGIRLLNSGCVGDGPRPLIGSSNPPQKTYTIVDIPKRKPRKFTYQTYSAETHELIDESSLPDQVVGFNGVSIRENH